MSIQAQIDGYLSSQTHAKRRDMEILHDTIQRLLPGDRLWFLDGRNEDGKVVSNPNVGYGLQTIQYADGKTRDFYQVGMSANTTGISIYIMTIEDKTYLARTYGPRLGKAGVTGYCIKFRALKDIDLEVLKEAIRDGIARP